MNEFTVIFLAAALTSIVVHWLLTRRHIQHVRKHRATVPAAFVGKIPLAAHQKAADYTEAKVRLNLYELVIATVILLIWTIGGGLQLLDETWRSQGFPLLWTGTAMLLSFFAISSLLGLPLSYYRTFKLEQRFGFNKSTLKIFFSDIFKNMMLGLLIGTPMIVLVIWIMDNSGSLWWIYVWLTWLAFSLFMMWAYPAFIAPLFNKFRPLENQALKQRIENLLSRNGFTSQGIFVMDGSTRSTHGNAYFTGLGANKRIVFFDTLIEELSPEEIEAVLAHELGHFKCNHIKKRIVTLGVVFFIGLALLGWLINMPWFYSGLGVTEPAIYMALLLFIVIAPVFTFFLQPVFSWISRQHEFEADDFAAAQAQTENLIQALVKLYKENANTLTPDPVYSAFHDSHPPAPIRIKHLSTRTV
ncbi:MAG: peptidase M48 [Gammaproteobacteria bacterium RIFCSPLOWO2_02_47_7]|nr:MAG: peptidase M48 [Gammaproteobacteria bacterium RIFCSPLOWO2_02_47_7]OGT75025.1 MAG: peptidase M48 [Gammaproteobacteria bacterium RIFCSPLOWO2_12_47_11]